MDPNWTCVPEDGNDWRCHEQPVIRCKRRDGFKIWINFIHERIQIHHNSYTPAAWVPTIDKAMEIMGNVADLQSGRLQPLQIYTQSEAAQQIRDIGQTHCLPTVDQALAFLAADDEFVEEAPGSYYKMIERRGAQCKIPVTVSLLCPDEEMKKGVMSQFWLENFDSCQLSLATRAMIKTMQEIAEAMQVRQDRWPEVAAILCRTRIVNKKS